MAWGTFFAVFLALAAWDLLAAGVATAMQHFSGDDECAPTADAIGFRIDQDPDDDDLTQEEIEPCARKRVGRR